MAPSSITRIAPEHDETARLQAVLRKQQAAFAAEGPVALATRIDRINRLIQLFKGAGHGVCARSSRRVDEAGIVSDQRAF